MATPNSIREAGLNINVALTNIAQGVVQPQFVMRDLFPFVEVGIDSGQIIRFDDSVYEDVDDNRGDDTFYPEVQDGYRGRAFELDIKGFSYRVGQKKARRQENLGIDWGRRAQLRMMDKAGLKHEIESALVATNPASYAASNRVTLAVGNQFNEPTVNPGSVIRAGKSAVSGQIGMDPNVWIMGQEVFDGLSENETIKDRLKYTSKDSLTTDILAAMFEFQSVKVCKAIVKRNGVKSRVFGKHMVFGYTNPAGLNQSRIPYRVDGRIDNETPSLGYTYVYTNNPLAYSPYFDDDRGATVYKLDFDRSVEIVGVDDADKITHGYLIQNAVA